ncbi:MAG TPA: diaminopimelate epimerase [Pirellulales bacterium]|nr:diaminopimelate epimerase [Pirellulales bacterium]
MRFTKMQGAGNDYVYVDCFAEPIPADPAALARKIADRHFGVGGDGLILICPSKVADARMRMFNADGSEAEMCGNGVRCVAKYVYDHGIAHKPTLKIETGRGVLSLDLEVIAGRAERVRVDMGEPILEANRIPVLLPSDLSAVSVASQSEMLDHILNVPLDRYLSTLPAGINPIRLDWFEQLGVEPRMTAVSMGNPHLILYCRNTAAVPLLTFGSSLETLPIFPRRINVHFVQAHSPHEVTMCTWERGSGITLACGTGASAVCVAGVLTKHTDRKILAHLPGGDLELEWNAADNHVYMTGPAVEVFSGEWEE